jgi:hypothetical protein
VWKSCWEEDESIACGKEGKVMEGRYCYDVAGELSNVTTTIGRASKKHLIR